MRLVLAHRRDRPWGLDLFRKLKADPTLKSHEWILVHDPESLDAALAKKPEYVFFTHWGHKIPKTVVENHVCVSFHAADLPKYRGGSPIQNQVLAGLTQTKLSVFRTTEGLDEGPILLKLPLSLEGDLDAIFARIEASAFEAIRTIVTQRLVKGTAQKGEPTVYKRRTAEDNRIRPDKPATWNNDLVRVLGSHGYPPAYIEMNDGSRLYVTAATLDAALEKMRKKK